MWRAGLLCAMPAIIIDLVHTPPASACQREDRAAFLFRVWADGA